MNSEHQNTLGAPNQNSLASITDAFATLDDQWRFVYLNGRFAELIGSTVSQALGKTIWELLPNHQQTEFGALYQHVAETSTPGALEAYFQPAGVWLSVRVYPAPTGISILAINITSQKRAEEDLRKQQEHIAIALEAAKLGTWDWSFPTDEVYWNEEHFLLFGMEPHKRPQTPNDFARHVHPDDFHRVWGQLEQTIQQKAIYDTEFRAVRDDGQTRWMSGYGRITEEVDGKPSRMSGVISDITDRKLTEQALLESQERLQIVLDSITDHTVITTNTEAIITGWNPGAQHVFGFTDQEAIGQPFSLIFTPEDRASGIPATEMNTARQQGRAADEQYHLHKNGSRFYMSGVLSRLNGANGQLLGYVKVARDLSERQQMEQALREADQRKDDFLAMLAHELRNPLAPIRNMLQILTMNSQDEESIRSGVAMMSRQVDHLVRLIDDLLDVSRISRGLIELRHERIDLSVLVAQAVDAVRPLYESPRRVLSVTLPNAPLLLQGDSTRLTQVLTNLLVNGWRYTREGGHVWVRLEKDGREALLVVSDDGIGLADHQLTRIFERFAQVDTALDRSQGGLGLGLTLVKELVKLHGGRVEARSEGLGQGSEFLVHLPLLSEESNQKNPNTDPVQAMAPDRQILVVDDNRDAADTLSLLLKMKGQRVKTCYGGQEALEAAEQLRPSVILLDISMPELDGFQTCQLIRQQPWGQAVVLIALTGYGQEDDKRRSKEAGFDGHLVKPVELKSLIDLIELLTQPGSEARAN